MKKEKEKKNEKKDKGKEEINIVYSELKKVLMTLGIYTIFK